MPRARPSLPASMMQRTRSLPVWEATSMTRRSPSTETARASLIRGSCPAGNLTSTTEPDT